jgi:hypothetical protein
MGLSFVHQYHWLGHYGEVVVIKQTDKGSVERSDRRWAAKRV